jgi:CII-binding regulator of phage lambda lysogenization HflD
LRDRVLALAGLLQSVRLVAEMAKTARPRRARSRPASTACSASTPTSTEEVYGGAATLLRACAGSWRNSTAAIRDERADAHGE